MKVKTSVTLSRELLNEIDRVAGPGCNRSALIEEATRDWLRRRARDEANRHDAGIYAKLTPEQIADSDVLEHSVDPDDLGDELEKPDQPVFPGAARRASG